MAALLKIQRELNLEMNDDMNNCSEVESIYYI